MADPETKLRSLQKKNAVLEAKIEDLTNQLAAKEKSSVSAQDALASLKQLHSKGFISAVEHDERRQQVLDKLVSNIPDDDIPVIAESDKSILPEEARLGGETVWLGLSRKAVLKYPFGKPFSNPLLNGLLKSKTEVPKGVEKVPVFLVEIAHENQSRFLGFCRHFFLVASRDTYEILNVYKYDQMKRWIFQTFLTVDFGRYESQYFMFRMEINKARAIQKLLLKYIEIAQESGEGANGAESNEPLEEQDKAAKSWLQSFWE